MWGNNQQSQEQIMDSRPWLKRYDFWVPNTINYPHMPLSRLLVVASIAYPQHTATLFYDATLTYAQLRAEVTRLAAALQDLGIGKGDHIGVMLPNSPQYVIAFYAVQWLGATAVNMSTLWVAREIADVIRTSEMIALITEDTLADKALESKADSNLKHLVTVGLETYMSPEARETYLAERDASPRLPDEPWHHRWDDLMQAEPCPFDVDIDPKEDVAVIQYTGGTTGAPKAAMMTHYGLVANVIQAAAWVGKYANDGEETVLCVVPFSHGYGMNMVMNRAIFHGYCMALIPHFDVSMLIDVIERYRPTHFYSVPALLRAILDRRQTDQTAVKSLKLVGTGSSPLPRELMMRYEAQIDGLFIEGYGLTEAGPLVTLWHLLNAPNRGSVGIPLPDVIIKIVDAQDGTQPLPAGEVGEIIVSAPQVMKGYWNHPEETAEVLHTDADGQRWLHTGDLGYMDENGYLYVVGRKKYMIIVAGFNVVPAEVEAVLEMHAGVQEAAVIGVPDKTRGERVQAYVVLNAGAAITRRELIDYCKENLASYKVPRRVIFRDSLPKGSIGKVSYEALIHEASEAPRRAGERPDFTPALAPDGVIPATFFTEMLPRDFAAYAQQHPPNSQMADVTYTVQYNIDGEIFTIEVTDGVHMTVTHEPAAKPDIAIETDRESWHDSVTGRVFTGLSPVAQGATARRLSDLKDVRGKVHLELKRPDGTLYRATVTYNGDTNTSVTVNMTTDAYSQMSRGKLSGTRALLTGRLRAKGDLGFLRTLASLRE
jgi:long-chain acyl-CoA synthetase